ncbi:MAG: hypothetical protein LC768_10785 [Acidobacteria bacterium]|nr:hypothetical protein [Acidobacteriota bacterium]MCA1638798.1 hypothetical protein [Acidobacteriota bacterium]
MGKEKRKKVCAFIIHHCIDSARIMLIIQGVYDPKIPAIEQKRVFSFFNPHAFNISRRILKNWFGIRVW